MSTASHSLARQPEPDPILDTIARLRQLTQLDLQHRWRVCLADVATEKAVYASCWKAWAIATINERHHIAWKNGETVLWLGQRLVIPAAVENYPIDGLSLRIALTWWASVAEIYINGELVQEGDLFDCSARILLSSAVEPGEVFDVALRLMSPGHDDGALVRSHAMYERSNLERLDVVTTVVPEPGFVADELDVLQRYVTTFAPEKRGDIAQAITSIQWSALPDRQLFDDSLAIVRQQLRQFEPWIKQRTINLLGHAHLDLAWLWSIRETWEAAERTFKSVLQLQREFPDLIFCHSTPALYEWLEQHRPQLFAAIREQITSQKWEVVAGLWVEPEFNLVSGESIVRQVLYGQRYVYEKFGRLSEIAWLPDSFGFCWQLPQILRQGGVRYFVTQKLRWNDTNDFPHDWFWWRSPDGSQILSVMAPPIGTDIDPIKMADYACNWESKTGLPISLWLPGVGDHGGGPTRDMLEVTQRWQQSPLFPTLEFSSAQDFLDQISACSDERGEITERECRDDDSDLGLELPVASHRQPKVHTSLPIWDDELYLELHRGCYTTHADQKRWNRECESLLYQSELYASIAALIAGTQYPKADIESSWKAVLFNQFHDILPGSSIPEVYEDTNPNWEYAHHTALRIRDQAIHAIAQRIDLSSSPHPDAQPIVVFNSLNWTRSHLVEVPIPTDLEHPSTIWSVVDHQGDRIPCQVTKVPPMPVSLGAAPSTLLFRAEVNGLGYRLYWLYADHPLSEDSGSTDASMKTESFLENVIENEYLQITVDPLTGDIHHLFDKHHQHDILRSPGNQLQAFRDRGQYWDAWNIDPDYENHPLPGATLLNIQQIESGLLRSRLRVIRQLGQSTFCQDYVLEAESPILKIITEVDWRERHTVVKAAFPLTTESDYATYEIPFGAIQRSTCPHNSNEHAKWEVPALHWADLSTSHYGVSLINTCKHGYDSQPSQLRLTLLRGSVWPDPNADQGIHQFMYAIYPHAGDWIDAKTVQRGHEANQPFITLSLQSSPPHTSSLLPSQGQFLNLPNDNVVISAFKQSDDDPNHWIVRFYECHRHDTDFDISALFQKTLLKLASTAPGSVQWVNLLEGLTQSANKPSNLSTLLIDPCAIASISLQLKPASSTVDESKGT
ncbi:MAG: alpha-mannosidase [Elainellaceae cyanobacterium]